MKFLIDAHRPPPLVAVLTRAAHDAVHTHALPAANRTRDGIINELSLREQRVVITKDTDFFYSHILHGRPWRLVLVRTENIRTADLRTLFEQNLATIVQELQTHT